MAIRDLFKVSRKTFFNPRGWLGYDDLKHQSLALWDILKGVCTVQPALHTETFEQAMTRLNLTEADVKIAISRYRWFAFGFLFLALLAFIYAFYLLFQHHTVLGWLLALCVCALFSSQAFRFDFWSFQMRKRQLGVSFEEWKRSILGDDKRGSS